MGRPGKQAWICHVLDRQPVNWPDDFGEVSAIKSPIFLGRRGGGPAACLDRNVRRNKDGLASVRSNETQWTVIVPIDAACRKRPAELSRAASMLRHASRAPFDRNATHLWLGHVSLKQAETSLLPSISSTFIDPCHD